MKVINKLIFYYKLIASIIVTLYFAVVVIVRISIGRKKEIFFGLAIKWSNTILNICRIELRIIKDDTSQLKEPVVYVSNHSSLFDIPIVVAACQDDIAIMYKKELERIPIFGLCLKLSPYIAVNRQDPKSSMQSIEEATKAVQGKYSVLIFPEGTRSEDGTIGSFKRGAFMLASRSGKPLIPVIINGSNNILPKGKKMINSGEVKVYFKNKIDTNNKMNRIQEIELMNNIKNLMESTLNSTKNI